MPISHSGSAWSGAFSAQNDYVTAFWFVCLAEAVLAWRSDDASIWTAFRVGAALGLALLTKGTTYIFAALPLLLLAAPGPSPARAARRVGMLAVAGMLVLSLNAPHWFRNVETLGSPLGPRSLGSATEVGDDLRNEVEV